MKKTLEGINSRLEDVEEHVSDLEDRIMENTLKATIKKNFSKMRISYGIS